MEREQLRVTGLTGVELSLPIAGPGSRSYAFIIDWHIRVLLALAWFGIGWLVLKLISSKISAHLRLELLGWTASLPAALIFVLYHPLLENLMRGRTPGKRIAGVRLVTRKGGLPSVGAILMRNVFRLLDSIPMFYFVGLAACVFTTDRVRIGDLAAGTVLIGGSAVSVTIGVRPSHPCP